MKQRISKVDKAVAEETPRAAEFLRDIISIPSTEGAERDVQDRIAADYAHAGLEVTFAPISEKLKDDPEYSPGSAPSYSGRFNLVAQRHGTGGGRSLIINTHSDVVPALDWQEAFIPKIENGSLCGRGAVDAKGQVATMYLVLLALQRLKLHVSGTLEVQVVIDEEIGGNGTLALLRSGRSADAALVLEPTGLRFHTANRGAVWFRFTVAGEAVHMARKHEAHSAVDHTVELLNILSRYEKDLLDRARSDDLFGMYQHPVQVNVGKIAAGEWPATVAAKSVVEGGVGFLPGATIEDIKRELRERVETEASGWLRSNYTLEFPGLHNEPFRTPTDAPVVNRFQMAMENAGLEATPSGWIASCDARLFSRIGGMDTVVFGPGDLTAAHARGERLDISEMETAARVLVRFVLDWCR